ncbi:metallophosphoesterase [Enterococcus sp. DIV0242_7C1]|uniref:2',3'-cyclic-nucleotide 2'-phosphodiesterase/3'-nucleotidase n=1 Tax=Candidatus Enterococcus dunnyi TaxID=1834192 RepID=A0A200ITL3_9ENTE|nr:MULTISPECIES: metallophosphoesterase [unclassified Enterococcus]MBO0471258.1 metallophosphoesterase [Enterococcus sp. DIV0242_7C1]OUZ28352.1 hypothetical protein A5889_003107 [Enterococcus sp. 9D6_DIV0238]
MTELTILGTTDIHGFLTEAESESGVCSLSAIAENFDAPILIDNGDFLVGSPQSTFFNTTKMISPLIELANKVGFDVMVPGNHDFDYGLDFLVRQAAAFKGKYVCANVLGLDDHLIFDPYAILERSQLKIGVIGVITSAMPQISDYDRIKGVKFLDVIETLNKWVPIVREKVDVLVVSYHGGIERDMMTGASTQYDTGEDQTYRIIDEVNGIDGLICGHQHRTNAGITNDTAFVQPGYRGNYVGELSFSVQHRQIINKQAQLIATREYPPAECQVYDEKAYQLWLQQKLNLGELDRYLRKRVPNTFYSIKLQDETIGGFLQSFKPPYTLSTYHISKEELKEYLQHEGICGIDEHEGQIDPEQQDYRITTNTAIFPKYRLETNYIYNVFDEYLSFISQ